LGYICASFEGVLAGISTWPWQRVAGRSCGQSILIGRGQTPPSWLRSSDWLPHNDRSPWYGAAPRQNSTYGAYSADAEIAQHEKRGPLDLARLPRNICGRQSAAVMQPVCPFVVSFSKFHESHAHTKLVVDMLATHQTIWIC